MEYHLPYQQAKDATVISNFSPPTWASEPWGNSRRKEYPPSSNHQTAATPYGVGILKKLRMGILAPDSWGVSRKNDFSEPRLLHLPTHRKGLNSLTWDIWFSLTITFWLSDYLPFVAQLLYNLVPPLASSEQFSQDYLKCCLPGMKS